MRNRANRKELIEFLVNGPVADSRKDIGQMMDKSFTDQLSTLLSETPTLHISKQGHFFLSFFLGSVLTLPYTSLMSKLNIKDILFQLDQQSNKLKLVFKTYDQGVYKLKCFVISTESNVNLGSLGFTDQELSEIKEHLTPGIDSQQVQLEGYQFNIYPEKGQGFKLKVSREMHHQEFFDIPASNSRTLFTSVSKQMQGNMIPDFGPFIAQLSSEDHSVVRKNIHSIFDSLKSIYKHHNAEKVLSLMEEAYHGYLYGFFRLNYKKQYKLDCYVERIGGKGYVDMVLLSRNSNNSPIPIIIEVKSGLGASAAIQQIHENGYMHSLINIRTNAKTAVLVGVDFHAQYIDKSPNELEVSENNINTDHINIVSHILKSSIDDIAVQKVKDHIHDLYYASIKSGDLNYLGMSLLGQFISDTDIQGERYVFKHSGTITQGAVMTLVFKKADSDKGIVLNISSRENNGDIMLHGSAVRLPAEKLHRDAVPDMRELGITTVDIVSIEVNSQAKKFHNYIGGIDSFIKISNGINVQDNNIKKYKGTFEKVECIAVRNVIEALDKQDADDRAGYETDIDDVLEPSAKRVKQEKHKYHSSLSDLFSTRLATVKDLINSESDIQAIIQGLFTGQTYNDQRIQVLSEVSSGIGRIDIALIFQGSDDGVVHDPVILELKYITRQEDSSMRLKNAIQSSISQLSQYVQTFKSATDSKSAMCVSLVFNKSSTSGQYVTIYASIEAVSHTSSSVNSGGKLSNIFNYKQEPKILQMPELLSDNENKPVPKSLDLSGYYLNDEHYEKLIVFLSKPSSSVREVNFSNSGIDDKRMQKFAEMLKSNTFINKINLSKNQITDVGVAYILDAMVAKENLPHIMNDRSYHGTGCITSLDLSDNRINNKVADCLKNGLKKLYALEELKLARTDIESDGIKSIVEGIQNNYMLQILDLSGLGSIHLEENTIKMLFANQPSLRSIELSGSNMNLGEINAIIRAVKLASADSNLESISLSGPQDIQQGESIDSNSLLDLMNNNKKVKKFALTNAGINDAKLSELAIAFKDLTYLDLSHNIITNVQPLSDSLKEKKSIQHLVLHNNKINDATSLTTLHSSLIHLDLADNSISHTHVEELMASALLDSKQSVLKHLDLSGVNMADMTENAMIDIAIHLLHSEIESLRLSNCNIDDRLTKKIFSVISYNRDFRALDLSHNNIEIKDQSILLGSFLPNKHYTKNFLFFSGIRDLNLAYNKISDKGALIMLKQVSDRAPDIGVVLLNLDLSYNLLTDKIIKEIVDKLSAGMPISSLKMLGHSFEKKYVNQLINSLYGNYKITNLEIDKKTIYQADMLRLSSYLLSNSYHYQLSIEQTTQAEMPASACLTSSRTKRYITDCKISWDDIDKISSTKTRKQEDIIIDVEKFLKYSKQHAYDIEKSKQLVSLANEIKRADSERIVGDYKNVLDKVIEVGSYKQYIGYERLNYLGHHSLIDNYITPKLKAAFVKVAGRTQIGYGMYSTSVVCQQAEYDPNSSIDCMLSVADIGYSFLSEPIAKVIGQKISSSVLAQKVLGVNLAKSPAGGGMIARGLTEAGTVAFDIIDITRASIQLRKCTKKADGETTCSDKEVRDAIASITFSGISIVSVVSSFALSGDPVVTVVVGSILLVFQVIYGGVSNIIEYSQMYNTTHAENWSIFWRTILQKKMSEDLEHLAARHHTINALVEEAWKILLDSPDAIVAISLGLGNEYVKYHKKCVSRSWYASDKEYEYQQCHEIPQYDFAPAYSRIDLSHKHDKMIELSRVLPKDIKNAIMLCLPKITREEYEKGLSQSRPEAVFQCENAAVLLHKQRGVMQSADTNPHQTIMHYLKNIISGSVIGSSQFNNYFSIFAGNASIFGTSVPYSIFKILDKNYSGIIYLSGSSNNILDLSGLAGLHVVNVEYHHTVPLTMFMTIQINGTSSRIYALQKDVHVRYVGSNDTIDAISCTWLVHDHSPPNTTYTQNFIIDSCGVKYNTAGSHDLIENCYITIMSPNTIIRGQGGRDYIVYVKQPEYKYGKFDSHIDTPDGANIVFQMSFFKYCEKIEYSASTNSLNIHIPLSLYGTYTITLSQYAHNDNTTEYKFIDKNGAYIIPLVDPSNATVENFLVRQDIQEKFSVESAIWYYQHTSYADESYGIYTEIRYEKDIICVFGSINNDLIIENDDIAFMSGGKGKDVYYIDDHKKEDLYIHNHSTDLALDFLVIPSTQYLTIRIYALDITLHFALKNITLCNYLLDRKYQHLVITDPAHHTVMPIYDEISEQVSLVPFYYTNPTRDVYVLSHNITPGIIGIDSEDITFYRQENNLLITDRQESFGILNIILQDYYIQQKQWQKVMLYSYSNGVVGDIIDLSNIMLSKADAVIPHIHNSIIDEYIVDGSESIEMIDHNNKLGLDIIVFQNTSLDNLTVVRSENDLVLFTSGHVLKLNQWYTKDHDRVSALEFNDGLEAQRIWLAGDFKERITFNLQLSDEIKKIGNKVLSAVLHFMIYNCARFHNDEKNYFLIDAFESAIRISGKLDTAEEVKFLSDNTSYNAATVLMLLLAKNYNRLILESPHIQEEDLYELGKNCFDIFVDNQAIKEMMRLVVNYTSSGYKPVYAFIMHRNENMQQIIKHYAADWFTIHHKHRHHHGEDIFNHQKTHRNINKHEKQDDDMEQYYKDNITPDHIAESVWALAIESSNLTWN